MHTIKVPHNKNTRKCHAVTMQTPEKVVVPVSMHIGAPSRLLVKSGDRVSIGQPIAEPTGMVSSYIHAPISGTVKSIGKARTARGHLVDAVTILSDGEGRFFSELRPPRVTDAASFVEAIRDSGAVGLGGAGFPTAVKLLPDALSRVDTVIVNGAECEPYITSDTRTMLERSGDIAEGVQLLRTYLGIDRIIVAIEDNKPECRDKLKPLLADTAEIRMLASRYPHGGEKMLVYRVLRRKIPEGKLPIDVGVIVLNCTTLAFIARYVRTGVPLVSKCVTVDGDAVRTPMNVSVPIGTPISDVFAFAGGFTEEPAVVLYGGPMMGITVPDLDVPVLKNTNALLAFTGKEARKLAPSACLRCGRCVSACPMSLSPIAIAEAYERRDAKALCALKVNLCIECGCCAYSCPANRRLVQTNQLAKPLAASEARKKAEAKGGPRK